MEFVDGVVDAMREAGCSGEIAAHNSQIQENLRRLDGYYNSSWNSPTGEGFTDNHACNTFVASSMKDVYGVADFLKAGRVPMTAAEIHRYLSIVSAAGGPWARTDGLNAILAANSGKPIVAVTSKAAGFPNNHVAVVVPGGGSYSYRWKSWTPLVMSTFLNDRTSPVKCAPCFASQAFSKDKEPDYYVREK